MSEAEFTVVLLTRPVALKGEALHHTSSLIPQANTFPHVAIVTGLMEYPVRSLSPDDVIEKRDGDDATVNPELGGRPGKPRDEQNSSRNTKFLQEAIGVSSTISESLCIKNSSVRVSHLYQI